MCFCLLYAKHEDAMQTPHTIKADIILGGYSFCDTSTGGRVIKVKIIPVISLWPRLISVEIKLADLPEMVALLEIKMDRLGFYTLSDAKCCSRGEQYHPINSMENERI